MNENVSALTIVFRTPDLIQKAYESFRKFYPEMLLFVINNSGKNNSCTIYMEEELFKNDNNVYMVTHDNIGHGAAFDEGVDIINSDYIYYFDSDVIMNRGGVVEAMLDEMSADIYGIGKIIYTDLFGRNIPPDFKGEKLRYLYLVVGLLNRRMYYEFHKWTKFGLVGYKAMLDIHNQGLSNEILKDFPIFSYVRHLSGGTRSRFGDCEDIVPGFKGRKGNMGSELD